MVAIVHTQTSSLLAGMIFLTLNLIPGKGDWIGLGAMRYGFCRDFSIIQRMLYSIFL